MGIRTALRLGPVHGQHRPASARGEPLEHCDVKIVEDGPTGETIRDEVCSNHGVGYCKSTSGAVRHFQRLTERNNPLPTDRVFPKFQRRLFNTILEEEGLKTDREGQPRTAYCLRYTSICLRQMKGADIYQIAMNCRTRVEMIEILRLPPENILAAAAINVRRKKTKKKETPENEEG